MGIEVKVKLVTGIPFFEVLKTAEEKRHPSLSWITMAAAIWRELCWEVSRIVWSGKHIFQLSLQRSILLNATGRERPCAWGWRSSSEKSFIRPFRIFHVGAWRDGEFKDSRDMLQPMAVGAIGGLAMGIMVTLFPLSYLYPIFTGQVRRHRWRHWLLKR